MFHIGGGGKKSHIFTPWKRGHTNNKQIMLKSRGELHLTFLDVYHIPNTLQLTHNMMLINRMILLVNCLLFSLKNWIKVTPQMKRLVNMNLVFITYTNIFKKLVNIIPIFNTLSCIYHLGIKTFKEPHISQYQENI